MSHLLQSRSESIASFWPFSFTEICLVLIGEARPPAHGNVIDRRPMRSDYSQLFNRRTGGDRNRASFVVGEMRCQIDAQMAVERGHQILWVERSLGGIGCLGIGRTDDLAHAEPAAG